MTNSLPKKNIAVLKSQIGDDELNKIIDKKKTSLFGSLIKRVKKSDVIIEKIETTYEPYAIMDGRYYVDFYRKSSQTIDVDSEVTEIVIGNGVFPVNKKKGVWKKIGTKLREEMGIEKNTVELKFDEHVIVDKDVHTVLNYENEEIEEQYKITAQMIENYPEDILKQNNKNVKNMKLKDEDITKKVFGKLKESIGKDVRIVSETLNINQIKIIYVPIFEVRCMDQNKKVGLLRIDGINKQVL